MLASPAAIEAREESLHAYADLSPTEAEELLSASFPEALAALNGDPARSLSDSRLDRNLGNGDAVVTTDGKTQLLEGTFPVEAENDEGELDKVDLSLEETAEGYAAENPIVEVSIADSASGGVVVGNQESAGGVEPIAVTQVGAGESAARPFGDKNIFFGEVDPGSDTDLLVSPTTFGVELSDLLRSVDSPETLRFHLDLPAGAEIHEDQGGGAEVTAADGSSLYEIPRPVSIDAQGSTVLTTLSVEGDAIVLDVPHRGGEVAYPILVDPEFQSLEMNWNTGNIPGIPPWVPYQSAANNGIYYGTEDTQWPGSHGLFFAAQPGYLAPGAWTQLVYFAPNLGTYIQKASINYFWRGDQCSLVKDPYDYDGSYIYWEGGHEVAGHWNGSVHVNDAYSYGNSMVEAWGNEFVFGYGNSSGKTNPCWRNVANFGSIIWLEDLQYPSINSATGAPTGWVKKDETARTLNVTASDEGLGVRTARLIAPGGAESTWNHPSCGGTYENPCPATESGVLTYKMSQFPFEGETSMSVVVEDPTKKKANRQFTIKMDGTPPKVTLNGQLARITEETGEKEQPQSGGNDHLSLPVYNLKVTSEDGTASEVRSGAKEIKLYLDGSETPLKTSTQSCSTTCPRTQTLEYPVALSGLAEGKHKLEIEALDLVGNAASRNERKIEFEYFPATGMKDEYVLQHFLLPDGHDYSEEPDYGGPEIAVNVTNGNVVFHERDFKVASERANLELERIYNSQLPTAKDAQWGHGWALAQTPELKAESASTGTMVRTGEITNPVKLPESTTQPTFSQKLHAEIEKRSGGGYEVGYETDPEVAVFAASGRIQESRVEESGSGSAEGGTQQQETATPVFSSSFGSSGTGNGQFALPGDVALDPKGNIWVADTNNHRLEQFSQKGEFLKSLGAKGAGNGQFSRPKSIAFDAKGNMWVADAGNNRLQQFNEKGEFLKAVGSSGSGNGQFSGPEAIAIDAKGNIWVADTYNDRIQELNENGEFVKVANPSGLGFIEPTGIDVGPQGNIWITDWASNRVVELSEEGSLVRKFGSSGAGNGQFNHPASIAVDSRGGVWVLDQSNSRIQKFSQSGQYLTQFGSAGSGSGQFNFGTWNLFYSTGVAVDSKGGIWITDTNNNRIQKLALSGYAPTYATAFGAAGTGNGQFAHPADVAIDPEQNLWVVDENNNRVQEFNAAGEYVSQFGSAGSGNGQFNRPTAIAISPLGNIWVADAGNCRLQEFNQKGEFLGKTGSCGFGNGQFGGVEGIAIDATGNIWVADTYHAKLQELNEAGEFIRAVGSSGSGPGQLCAPTGVAVGPNGHVFTSEWCNNRVSEFDKTGGFIRSFGASGTGNGQFTHPDGIEVDSNGNVWVGDEGNRRVEEFSSAGEYITQFGSAGSAGGQFNFTQPIGIEADSIGHLWVTDTGNNRVQKFSAVDAIGPNLAPYYEPPAVKYEYSGSTLTGMKLEDETAETEPAMSVSVSSGLTTSVSAGSAGSATLSYTSGKLTAESDSEGETKYEYDASNRLKKVTLPNGTWASIAYDSYSRATEVTVNVAGVSKTTHFWYGLEPHETKVWGGGNPEIVYSIGEGGSVFKWSYAEVPPTITSISGSLWANRNSTTPVEAERDQTLFVHASSPQEIASISVIENGSAVLAETTCEDKSVPPAHNCDEPSPLEWITNPSEHAAGQLDLEVVATDFLGHATAEKFFVTIPQSPPPSIGAPERPSFGSVKRFREAYGQDRNNPLTEQQMNTLILELLYEWEIGDPVASAAVDSWGVPMRQPELAEMEYRREYANRAAEVVPEWAEEHAASSYGGFYVDDAAGGVIYVGFTENQHALVESLKQDPRLINPGAIQEFAVPPVHALRNLQELMPSVRAAAEAEGVGNQVTAIRVAESGDHIVVGALNQQAVREAIQRRLGSSVPVVVEAGAEFMPFVSRYAGAGPVVAGAAIGSTSATCTAGYSSRAGTGNPVRGQEQYSYFLLTAAHCFPLGTQVGRLLSKSEGLAIGKVKRSGFQGYPAVDGAGVGLIDENLRSHSVLNGSPLEAQSIQGAEQPSVGRKVCWSGVTTGHHCGFVKFYTEVLEAGRPVIVYVAANIAGGGDSGGPVWDPATHRAVGQISGSSPEFAHCEIVNGSKICDKMAFTPLRQGAGTPGIEATLGVEVLKEG